MTQNVNIAQNDQKSPVKPFRLWVQQIWYENCEEHLTYGEQPYKIHEYWNKYKWWLKREYKHQRNR